MHGTLTEVKQSTKIDVSLAGKVITVTKVCAWDDRDTYTPAYGESYDGDSSYSLATSTQETLPGGFCKITLVFSYAGEDLPETTYVEQSCQLEAPIQQHPDFSDWSDEWDDENQRFLPTSDKYGIESYIKGTTSVTSTEYFATKPSSAKDDIGKTESPGVGFGDSSNWLLIGANRQKQGGLWVMQKTFLYSAEEWNTDIYGS